LVISLIYLPHYKWVLENKLQKLVTAIRIISKNKPVVLLDYNTTVESVKYQMGRCSSVVIIMNIF